MEEKAQEIEVLQKAQEELKMKTTEEITELKKEIDHLVVEKAHLFDSWVKLEATVVDSCKHVLESTTKPDAVAREKWLGDVIVQSKSVNNILEALIHRSTPPKKIIARKGEIKESAKQLDKLEQDEKKVVDSTTQFCGNVVQDEQLVKLTTHL